MILSLHQLDGDKPQTFDQVPNYIFVKVSLPDQARLEGFFRMDSLSPALRGQVWAEVFGERALGDETPKQLPKKKPQTGKAPENLKKRVFVGANPEDVYTPPTVVETFHNSVDDWLTAVKVARSLGGELCVYDNPRARCVGFIHHPDDEKVDSQAHFLGIPFIKAFYASPEMAESLGLTPEAIREKLATEKGRKELILGSAAEEPPTDDPRMDDLLAEAMLRDPISAYLRDDGEVEFPDISLWEAVPNIASYRLEEEYKRQIEAQEGRALRALRPNWVPEGWSRFVLPMDKDRVGVHKNEYTGSSAGAFIRRKDVVFRIFDDGMWDKCETGSMLQFLSREKSPSPEEALQRVLPLLEAEGEGPFNRRK